MINKEQSFAAETSPFLKGIGQIMLQDNTWTGLLFLAGIFCGSYMMGIAAILAVIAGTCTAKLLKYDKEEINSGLYGFSAALVGVALIFFFRPTAIIWVAILPGSALATIIQHFFILKKIPAFTFPFILVTWLLLFISSQFPHLTEPQLSIANTAVSNSAATFPLAFGQVIFQGSILAGILFIMGVIIHRPVAAIYALAAAGLSGILAYALGEATKDIYMGIFSYNAVLCAITFAGKKPQDIIQGLCSTVLSVLIFIQMRNMNLPALTFPFVMATWITLVIKLVLSLKPKGNKPPQIKSSDY